MLKETKWSEQKAFDNLTRNDLISNRYEIERESALFFAKNKSIPVFTVLDNGYKPLMESLEIEVLKLLMDDVSVNDITYILKKNIARIKSITECIEEKLNSPEPKKMLELILEHRGKSAKQMSIELNVSERVVKYHLKKNKIHLISENKRIILDYFKENKGATKSKAARDLGFSRTTINKYYKKY